jgi:Chaperone of endosialidase
LIPTVERSGLQTRITATGSLSTNRICDSRLRPNTLDKLARICRNSPDMKTRIPPILIIFALVCFALLPIAQAVVPPPDGGYPGLNTAEGQKALFSLTTGQGNTAVGWFTLESLTTGNFNTAIGAAALVLNTGDQNTATGTAALFLNTTGFQNTANGAFALLHNTDGSDNTATGFQALFNNTTGVNNTAVGVNTLGDNTTGSGNTAIGNLALIFNDTGDSNTATGAGALSNNTTGGDNTANGVLALSGNTIGNNNTAIGRIALSSNTNGGGNTANGFGALQLNINGNLNTATGFNALLSNTTGSFNIALGFSAGSNLTTGDNNIDIGSTGATGESGTIRIGAGGSQTRAFIAGIRGVTTGNADAIPVLIDSVGQLGTMSSSRRFKDDIRPMDKASEAVLALKPVTFHYKSDKTNRPEFGLIAEDVAAVNHDLVVRDDNGEIYTVRYDAVNAMLLNEFLKEHRKNEEQERTIAELKSGMTALLATVTEQAAQIQKVTAQLEMSKPARQMALNNP